MTDTTDFATMTDVQLDRWIAERLGWVASDPRLDGVDGPFFYYVSESETRDGFACRWATDIASIIALCAKQTNIVWGIDFWSPESLDKRYQATVWTDGDWQHPFSTKQNNPARALAEAFAAWLFAKDQT